MNDLEKLEVVRMKADQIENRARMEEQMIKNGGSGEGGHSIEKSMAINDMYIDAITAKLKILDQI